MVEHKHTKSDLTKLQMATVEAYRQQLAKTFPEVEILEAFSTNGIIHVRLNDASMRDFATGKQVIKLSMAVEDQFNVSLLPHTVPHEN